MRHIVVLRWPIHISVEILRFMQRIFAKIVSPISVHSVRLRNLIDIEPGEPNQLAAVFDFDDFETDPSRIPDYVDLNQLEESLDNDGTYFIWTCSCGAPGCAGLFDGVVVKHVDGKTTWIDLDQNRKFVFETTALKNAFSSAIIDGSKLLNERPGLEPTPEQNASAYQHDG